MSCERDRLINLMLMSTLLQPMANLARNLVFMAHFFFFFFWIKKSGDKY